MDLNNSSLHFVIIESFLKRGRAPSIQELSERFSVSSDSIRSALLGLQDYHGVVLHPHNQEIWVAHPFSTVPTGFIVRSNNREWWGNCAWCSLGVAALAGPAVTITTCPGFDRPPVEIRIKDGELENRDFVVHFSTPMAEAWDNVIATCAMMLLFDDEAHIDEWCARHGKPKGDVRPVAQVWSFAREWYGRHADQDWQKWTANEATELFARHGLDGPIWEIATQGERF